MDKSERIGELSAALAKAQGQIQGAVKDSDNPFFKSKYADLSSVWDACRAPLSENGLAVIQSPTVFDGMVSVETLLSHASGEWISDRVSATPAKGDVQAIGSTITYLRRYALSAIVGIAPEDDDGNAGSGKGKEPEKTPAKATKAESPEETTILATAKKEIDACKNSADLAALKAQKAPVWNKLAGKNLIDCRQHFTATEKRLAAKALSEPLSEPPRHPCPEGEERAGTMMSIAECLAEQCKQISTCPNWNKDLSA